MAPQGKVVNCSHAREDLRMVTTPEDVARLKATHGFETVELHYSNSVYGPWLVFICVGFVCDYHVQLISLRFFFFFAAFQFIDSMQDPPAWPKPAPADLSIQRHKPSTVDQQRWLGRRGLSQPRLSSECVVDNARKQLYQ